MGVPWVGVHEEANKLSRKRTPNSVKKAPTRGGHFVDTHLSSLGTCRASPLGYGVKQHVPNIEVPGGPIISDCSVLLAV
jgi:hypothetical protein